MAEQVSQEVSDKRRIQNRIAQRRFRQKKMLQKSVPSGGMLSDVTGFMYLDMPHHEFEPSAGCAAPSVHHTDVALEDDYSFFTDPTMSKALDSAAMMTSSSSSCPVPSQTMPYVEEGGYFQNTFPSTQMELEGHSDVDTTWQVTENSSSPDPSPTPFEGSDPHSGTKCRDAWMNPLHAAAQRGRDRIVRLLLQHGSEPDETDSDGLTPLMHAVIGGYAAVATLLLSHGAQVVPGAGPCGGDRRRSSPLHLAVLHQRENLLRLFLSHMAQERGSSSLVNSHDEAGRTPLFIAIDLNFEPGVVLLLQHGADLKQKLRIPP